LGGLVPSGYSLEGHTPQILSAGAASGSSQVKVIVNLSSKVHALIEQEQVRQQLVTQPLEQAAAIMASNPAVEKASFIITPVMAGPFVKKVPNEPTRFVVVISIPE
jgi:hypothetical protein